jgi:hypothetical protein
MNGAERRSTPPVPPRPHAASPPAPAAAREPARVVRARAPVRKRPPRTFPRALYTTTIIGWLALVAFGTSYYRLDTARRMASPLHPLLKPNGELGLLYGYAGTLAILVLAAYSARKRWRFLKPLGALSKWLNVHIFCGIAAPALITLHSSFKMHGAIAVGYWAMICVMLSGFVGYYLYKQIPRALSAGEDEAEGLRSEVEMLDAELQQRFGLQPAQVAAWYDAAAVGRAAERGALATLGFVLAQDLRLMLPGWRVPDPAGRRLIRRDRRRLRDLARRRIRIERRQVLLRQMQTLFGYWHAIHKPFAIVLFVTMALHIGIAVWLGYALPVR